MLRSWALGDERSKVLILELLRFYDGPWAVVLTLDKGL
jgi:hypothetical protein